MAHSNTVLAQLLKFIDRHDFIVLHEGAYRPQRKYRTLSQWEQFTVMTFAQLAGRASLRDICDSLCIPVNPASQSMGNRPPSPEDSGQGVGA